MDLIFKPLPIWPNKQHTFRPVSKFKAGYQDTLQLLDRELRHLKAKNIVIQAGFNANDIRLDGMPRVGPRPSHPGVILAFDSKHGALSYPCDTFAHWEDNLRAIALALEHLRTVDRYGVTKGGEQYRGWTALPAPPKQMTKDEAALYLSRFVGNGTPPDTLIRSPDARAITYKAAVFRSHPDRGGDPAEFSKVQESKEVLDG